MYPPDFITLLIVGAWSVVTVWAWGASVRAKLRDLHRFRDKRSRRALQETLASAVVAWASIAGVWGFLVFQNATFLALPLGAAGSAALVAKFA